MAQHGIKEKWQKPFKGALQCRAPISGIPPWGASSISQPREGKSNGASDSPTVRNLPTSSLKVTSQAAISTSKSVEEGDQQHATF
jgi:hypothetical protein